MSNTLRDSLIALMVKHRATWAEQAFDGNYTFVATLADKTVILFGFGDDPEEDHFLRQAELLLDIEGTRSLPQGEVIWKIAHQSAQYDYILTKGDLELARFEADRPNHEEEFNVPALLGLAEWVRDPEQPDRFHYIPHLPDQPAMQGLVQACPSLPHVIAEYIKAFGSCTSDRRDLPVLMFRSRIEAAQLLKRLDLKADVDADYQARLLELEIEYAERSLAEKREKLASLRARAEAE